MYQSHPKPKPCHFVDGETVSGGSPLLFISKIYCLICVRRLGRSNHSEKRFHSYAVVISMIHRLKIKWARYVIGLGCLKCDCLQIFRLRSPIDHCSRQSREQRQPIRANDRISQPLAYSCYNWVKVTRVNAQQVLEFATTSELCEAANACLLLFPKSSLDFINSAIIRTKKFIFSILIKNSFCSIFIHSWMSQLNDKKALFYFLLKFTV